MNNHKKIKWCRGMEITPAVFEAVDIYNAYMDHVAYRAASCERYGFFPDADENIVSTIEDSHLHIVASPFKALTRSGCIIHTDAIDKTFALPEMQLETYYITLVKEGEDNITVNGTIFSTPKYSFECKKLLDIDPDSIAIAKISFDGGHWNTDKRYILPSISINSSERLCNALQALSEDCSCITNTLTEKKYLESPSLLHLLNAELSAYDGTESPKALWSLLYKITTFLSCLNIDNDTVPPISQLQKFNNDDICLSLLFLSEYLSNFAQMAKGLDEQTADIPAVKIIKQKPPVSNDPKPEEPKTDTSYIKI